jgi:hypothetical protein
VEAITKWAVLIVLVTLCGCAGPKLGGTYRDWSLEEGQAYCAKGNFDAEFVRTINVYIARGGPGGIDTTKPAVDYRCIEKKAKR